MQAPVGFWDPAGLCKDGDVDAFKRRRVTEIKHGRVSMFACLGYITPEYFKWPGYCSPSAKLAFAAFMPQAAAVAALQAMEEDIVEWAEPAAKASAVVDSAAGPRCHSTK